MLKLAVALAFGAVVTISLLLPESGVVTPVHADQTPTAEARYAMGGGMALIPQATLPPTALPYPPPSDTIQRISATPQAYPVPPSTIRRLMPNHPADPAPDDRQTIDREAVAATPTAAAEPWPARIVFVGRTPVPPEYRR